MASSLRRQAAKTSVAYQKHQHQSAAEASIQKLSDQASQKAQERSDQMFGFLTQAVGVMDKMMAKKKTDTKIEKAVNQRAKEMGGEKGGEVFYKKNTLSDWLKGDAKLSDVGKESWEISGGGKTETFDRADMIAYGKYSEKNKWKDKVGKKLGGEDSSLDKMDELYNKTVQNSTGADGVDPESIRDRGVNDYAETSDAKHTGDKTAMNQEIDYDSLPSPTVEGMEYVTRDREYRTEHFGKDFTKKRHQFDEGWSYKKAKAISRSQRRENFRRVDQDHFGGLLPGGQAYNEASAQRKHKATTKSFINEVKAVSGSPSQYSPAQSDNYRNDARSLLAEIKSGKFETSTTNNKDIMDALNNMDASVGNMENSADNIRMNTDKSLSKAEDTLRIGGEEQKGTGRSWVEKGEMASLMPDNDLEMADTIVQSRVGDQMVGMMDEPKGFNKLWKAAKREWGDKVDKIFGKQKKAFEGKGYQKGDELPSPDKLDRITADTQDFDPINPMDIAAKASRRTDNQHPLFDAINPDGEVGQLMQNQIPQESEPFTPLEVPDITAEGQEDMSDYIDAETGQSAADTDYEKSRSRPDLYAIGQENAIEGDIAQQYLDGTPSFAGTTEQNINLMNAVVQDTIGYDFDFNKAQKGEYDSEGFTLRGQNENLDSLSTPELAEKGITLDYPPVSLKGQGLKEMWDTLGIGDWDNRDTLWNKYMASEK
tara:strand:- start:6765 stop:8891 length:2127 start_codon:yes stop_codon:yes gene_type:complete